MDTVSNYLQNLKNGAPTCLDLFCGAGGLSLGFCQAGGIPLGAADIDKHCISTYAKAFPFCKQIYSGDLRNWHPSFRKQDIDVIIGGPPCQGFSLARGLRFVDDPRNSLYKEFVRIVNTLKPKWIVMENVQGITNIGGGIILEQIFEDFQSIGYKLDCKVINMEQFGVPQARKRAIFLGTRTRSNIVWPTPTHTRNNNTNSNIRHIVTIHEALSDLPWSLGKYFSHRANSQMRGPRNRDIKTQTAYTLRVRGDEFAFCEKPAIGV
jgi:DNA (cytosine-5)-methyltransferase 1